MRINIDKVIVGDRFRKARNVQGTADSMKEIGQLTPILLDKDLKLISGLNRLEACKLLGHDEIECVVRDDLDGLKSKLAEIDENLVRDDLTEYERGAWLKYRKDIYLELYPETKSGVAGAHASNKSQGNSNNASEDNSFASNTAEKAGKSKRGIEQSIQIATELEEFADHIQDLPIANHKTELLELARIHKKTPDIARKIVARLKEDPDNNFKKLSADVNREEKRKDVIDNLESVAAIEAKEISGLFDVIVIDPPWPMKKIDRDERPNQTEFDYPTMSESELTDMHIPASDDCHVWLWTTEKFFTMAQRLLDSWGFKYVCIFTWHKPGGFQPIGLPQYNSEFALYARKGTPVFIDTKAFPVCFYADRGKHSEKPQEFYDMVRRVTAGRRLDMFNRRKIEGFETWGNQAFSG